MKSKRHQPLIITDLAGPDAMPQGDVSHGDAPLILEQRAQVRPASREHAAAMAALRAKESRRADRERGRAARTRPEKAAKPVQDDFARWAYPAAVAAALAWAGALVAFVLGFQNRFGAFDYSALQWTIIGLLAVLPAVFILLAAFCVRQGAKLAAETRRARALADDLAIPAALAADQTGGAMEAMRREIEKASAAAVEAQHPIAALREALSEESRKLAVTAAEAQETGRRIAESLGRERVALGELAGALQAQAAEAAEALHAQTRFVADASDLAQAQLHEAQAALAARAADLAVAAGDASDAATLAGEQLSRQVERLETAGESLTQRLQRLQLTMSDEREQLGGLADTLRLDQEDMAVQLETRRAQLAEAVAEAREGAAALDEVSGAGADSLRSLIATAAEEVQRLAEVAQREQEAIDAKARSAVSLFTGAVAEERASLEAQTRAAIDQLAAAAEEARNAAASHAETAARAAEGHAEAARAKLDALAEETAAKIDHLGEAAFAAGRRADELFDGRISAARRLIEQSAALVEESGQRSAQHIEAGLASARAALTDMQGLLAEIDDRFARLPEEARDRAEAVRDAVERGVGELTTAARRAAEETQAIDAAFQERVRRNYEVLSEAVRLMGRVAGAASPPLPPSETAVRPVQAPVPRPVLHEEPERVVERPPVEVRPAVAVGDRSIHVPVNEDALAARGAPLRPAALSEPLASIMEPRRAEPTPSAAAGLRPRLRLTPAPVEDAVAAMFEPRKPEPTAPEPASQAEAEGPSVPDEWTWKDLLSSMDEPVDDEALAERLMGEIAALGIDSGALLPRGRIDEIAAVLQAGDAGAAREVVRRLAPAAVRRLSRRVLTDKVLRAEADRYVRRYEQLLSESAQRDREGYMTAALIGSDPGRAYLLLDAAIGDLA